MRTQNTRRHRHSDTYVEVRQPAYARADKSLRYRGAGKFALARAVVEKVQQGLRRIVVLEAHEGLRPPVREHGAWLALLGFHLHLHFAHMRCAALMVCHHKNRQSQVGYGNE